MLRVFSEKMDAVGERRADSKEQYAKGQFLEEYDEFDQDPFDYDFLFEYKAGNIVS